MKIIDQFTGKSFQTGSFTAMSASVAANGTLGGEVASFITKDKVPYRIVRGDLSEIIDLEKAETGSIIRKNDGTVYIPFKKSNFQEMMVGPGSFVSKSFSSRAYLQVSASFVSKFSGIGDDVIIHQMAEEFYPAKRVIKRGRNLRETFVGEVTASLNIFESGSESASFSAIDNIGQAEGINSKGIPDFKLDYGASDYATHWLLRFDGSSALGIDLSSSQWVPTIFHRFRGGGADNTATGSELLGTSASLLGPTDGYPHSGSIVGAGIATNVNGVDGTDGTYTLHGFRARIAGDADSGSLYTFLGRSEILVYPRGTQAFVRSGSFRYSATSRNEATASGTLKTLFYRSGSNGPSGSYVTASGKGSPVHSDSDLRFNADAGFYSPPGTTSSFLVQTSSLATTGLGPTYITDYIF